MKCKFCLFIGSKALKVLFLPHSVGSTGWTRHGTATLVFHDTIRTLQRGPGLNNKQVQNACGASWVGVALGVALFRDWGRGAIARLIGALTDQ